MKDTHNHNQLSPATVRILSYIVALIKSTAKDLGACFNQATSNVQVELWTFCSCYLTWMLVIIYNKECSHDCASRISDFSIFTCLGVCLCATKPLLLSLRLYFSRKWCMFANSLTGCYVNVTSVISPFDSLLTLIIVV